MELLQHFISIFDCILALFIHLSKSDQSSLFGLDVHCRCPCQGGDSLRNYLHPLRWVFPVDSVSISILYPFAGSCAPKSVENSSASLSLECSNCVSIWTVPPGVCILAQATLPLRDCGSGGRDQTQTQRPNCLSSPSQVHIECGESGEVQCQNDTEELIFSHGENYMNILKRKTHMEVFVKHLAL